MIRTGLELSRALDTWRMAVEMARDEDKDYCRGVVDGLLYAMGENPNASKSNIVSECYCKALPKAHQPCVECFANEVTNGPHS